MNWLQRRIERLIRGGRISPYEAALYHLFGAEVRLEIKRWGRKLN